MFSLLNLIISIIILIKVSRLDLVTSVKMAHRIEALESLPRYKDKDKFKNAK